MNIIDDLERHCNNILNIVSANVKKYREEKGLIQMQLALEIGMTEGTYLGRAEIRKENHYFNIKHIVKITKILDINACKFFKL